MSPTFNLPSTILVWITTPLYESNTLSKISPLRLEFISPFGHGILSITASSNLSIPKPVFALVKIISSSLNPSTSLSSFFTLSTSALGKSILFITGIIVKSFSKAKYTFASVCASIPCAASTTKIAPSQAAKLLDTSYVKST